MKKALYGIPLFLSILALAAILLYPNFTLALGVVAVLVSLAFAVYSIIQKHRGKPSAYKNIFRELGIFVITLLLAILLGSWAGGLVNGYVSQFYGAMFGLVCGLVIAFAVGY
ncbi:MAG TPA: hypothetical protein VNJ29_01445, partial [Candidatus Nitrosotenuis sp.]|nr:hypothetical protein [Candidatus Nitrosotenuis sp.]